MNVLDMSVRTINISIDHAEIIKALVDVVFKDTGIKISHRDQFRFEFVKEGSPEYTTNKIKCKITKCIDLNNKS